MPSLVRTLLAEALGTFILILFGCGAVHAAVLTGAQTGLWQVAIVWGMGVALAAYCVGGVSGAHITPPMTIALAIWRKFPWNLVGPYIAVQLAGAFIAPAALSAVYSPSIDRKHELMGVKKGDRGSVITASCYGEFYPSPGGALTAEGKWSEPEWGGFQARPGFKKRLPPEGFSPPPRAL